jgi:predicted LPLAT superfamily acyltransferase
VSDFRACAIIPTHNHVDALDAILSRLQEAGLPVIVIDDASDAPIGERIRALCQAHADVEYQRHAFNGGKGFAVMCGIARASERGFTHAVQVDADGQHDLSSLDALLEMARLNPAAIVTGEPQFDQPIPLARRIWKPFTNFWVAINTLSLHIPDAMCGFRAYPIRTILPLVRKTVRGRRMDFDIEVVVKAYWAGIPLAAVPVRVRYPKENFSNFDVLRDNVLLTLLQTRLFFGMLLRAPQLVFRRHANLRQPGAKPERWASVQERGAYWGLRILAAVYRLLGRGICLAVMVPVVLYFFGTGRVQRDASRDYLMHLWRRGHLHRKPTLWLSFRHFLSFGASALDKLVAWAGNVPFAKLQGESLALLDEVEASGRGVFVITAHIGNPEVIRAVAALSKKMPVNVLMHTEHALLFNRLMKEFSSASPVRAFPVTKVGIDTAVILSEAIAKGEWVVIAGDRVPVAEAGRTIDVPFLGDLASFPQGPYILGALLKAPAFLLFCVRQGRGFHVHFSKFADMIELPRGDRIGAIRRHAVRYAEALEARVAQTPLQWFNFYPFWNASHEPNRNAVAAQRAAE